MKKKLLILKIFFISSFGACLFVCFDIFYQFIYGEDIFGSEAIRQDGDGDFVVDGRKLGGPFGDELIAGGFIQRFSLFAFFIFPLFYNKIFRNYSNFFIPLLFVFF